MTADTWDSIEFDDEDDAVDDLETDLAESLADPAFRASFEDARARSSLVRSLAGLRTSAELTQTDIAARMGTSQSAVSELEGGATDPRLSTLQRYARAVGVHLALSISPS